MQPDADAGELGESIHGDLRAGVRAEVQAAGGHRNQLLDAGRGGIRESAGGVRAGGEDGELSGVGVRELSHNAGGAGEEGPAGRRMGRQGGETGAVGGRHPL